MKESRFIELINLYIDRQIGPEEAAELESEIARSPAHRRTYLQYCRMHRACTLLFENFRAPASPLAQALSEAEEKTKNRMAVRVIAREKCTRTDSNCISHPLRSRVNPRIKS